MRNFKIALAILAAFAIYAYVSTEDYKTAKLEEAAATCQEQTAYTVPTFDQCINNQFEVNSDR